MIFYIFCPDIPTHVNVLLVEVWGI